MNGSVAWGGCWPPATPLCELQPEANPNESNATITGRMEEWGYVPDPLPVGSVI